MSDVVLDTVQVALFVDNFKIGNSFLLAQELKDIIKFDSSLDVNNMLGDDAPGELVRINAEGIESNTRISISKSKISLYWENSSSEIVDFGVDAVEVIKMTKDLCTKLGVHNGTQLVFSRVGYITTVIKKCGAVNEVSKLLNTSKLPISSLNDVQMTLTYNDAEMGKTLETTDIKFNKYLKIGSGLTKSKNEEVVVVQYDLNTRQNQSLNWDIGMVEKFIREAAQRSEKDAIYGEFFEV